MNVLEVKNLTTCFRRKMETFPVVENVGFAIAEGEVLGLVGESGCGKSVTSLSIMGLIPLEQGFVKSGKILFEGEDLLKKSGRELAKIRGNQIGMIFQEPMTSLNPFYTCGEQIAESLRLHLKMKRKEAAELAVKLLRMVEIPFPEQRVKEYPHQLSGGMRQRVLIAAAIACNPRLLIADEPTTALDVTVQAQILELIRRLKEEIGMSVLFITHDLGVVNEITDRVAVMYAGRIIEQAPTKSILRTPLHPYTKGLIRAIPLLHGERKRLEPIGGSVPDPSQKISGCRFCNRCPGAMKRCRTQEPQPVEMGPGHLVSCWLYEQQKEEVGQ